MLQSLFSFILALGILVFLHEMGHYLVARWCGVKVLQFSVGFGKPIYEWVSPKTSERWSIGWLPLGGFVRMVDERDPESTEGINDLNCAFNRQSVYRRIAIVLAGPVANLGVAWFIYSILSFSQTQQVAAVVAQPQPNTFAASVGLQAGDQILELNHSEIKNWQQLSWKLFSQALFKDPIELTVLRNQQTQTLSASEGFSDQIELSPRLVQQLGFYPFEQSIVISAIQPGSAAEQAGLQAEDQILAVNLQLIESSAQASEIIQKYPDQEVPIDVLRAGNELRLLVTPNSVKTTNGESIGRIGISLQGFPVVEKVEYSLAESIVEGGIQMVELSVLTLVGLKNMVTGDLSWEHLSGPVTIAAAAGESSAMGVLAFLSFLAMVSVSLGILNLLPIPMLDGGHLMYYLVEIFTGRPASDKWLMCGQRIGMALIGALTCVALFNDIQRLL